MKGVVYIIYTCTGEEKYVHRHWTVVMVALSVCTGASRGSHDLRPPSDPPHRDNAEHQEGQWLVTWWSCDPHVTLM